MILALYFFSACFLALGLGLRFDTGAKDERPTVDAEFCGVQRGYGFQPDYELWTLRQAIPGHPVGSTVSRESIERSGYKLPT